jgi:hypothetical protein
MAIGVKVPHRMKPENEPPSVKMKIRSFSPKGLLQRPTNSYLQKRKKKKKKEDKNNNHGHWI